MFFEIAVTALIVFVVRRHFTFWSRQGIPNSFSVFLEATKKPFHVVDTEAAARHGKVIGFYNFFTPALIVADLELAKKALSSEFANFTNHWHHVRESDYAGQSVFSLKDEKWKQMRHIITPPLSSAKIRQMQPLVEESIQDLLDNLQETSGAPVDIGRYMSGLTMDIIAATAFGVKVNTAKDPNNDIARHGQMFFGADVPLPIVLVIMWPWLAVDILGLSGYKRAPAKFFSELIEQIVKRRRQEPGTVRNDFLQFLMEAEYEGRALTVKEICDNGIVFMLAGHDTSSVTLTHVCYMLAMRQDIQEKALKEVDQFLNGKKDVTYDDLKELKYMDALINETLRFFPSVPRTMREASRDCKLGDVFVKKGTVINVSNYVIQHDPENFEQPDEFIPERFLPENVLHHNQQAFLAFAAGPRNCIGIRFAMFEMKLALLRLLRRFRFERCSETKDPLDYYAGVLVMTPKEATIKVVPRS